MLPHREFLLLSLVALFLTGCGREAPPAPVAETVKNARAADGPFPEKIAAKHLPNVFRLHEKVYSGGLPDGEPGFEELEALGVKTVISVDGARPEVDLAKKHGLRYVHLPHGYDGVPEERGRELAKAVREFPGPIYIHCHHGKHRSPAAAAVACVSAGFLKPSDALGVLKAAGTSENYRGLYESAESARRIEDGLLDAMKVEFRETAKLPPMAEAMVEIEHAHDHLKEIAKAGWRAPKAHPALDPPHEALLLREHFTELLRTDDIQQRPDRFRELTQQSESAAQELETALRSNATDPDRTTAATAAFERVTKHCSACHREFRDVPRKGKTLEAKKAE